MGVMPDAMCALTFLAAPLVDAAVPVYHIVVPDAVKASLLVPAVYLCHGVVLAFRRGCTMHDYLVNLSHIAISHCNINYTALSLTIAARHFVSLNGRQIPYCSKFTRLR